MKSEEIIALLPYQDPFLFVDDLIEISADGIKGNYQFRKDAFFYRGHFKNHPVTPGVILSETMAQIGVVSLGIYLLNLEKVPFSDLQIALTSYQVDFYLPVYPGDKVIVDSEKMYFRFNKLKCKVNLYDPKDRLACRGMISGMFKFIKSA